MRGRIKTKEQSIRELKNTLAAQNDRFREERLLRETVEENLRQLRINLESLQCRMQDIECCSKRQEEMLRQLLWSRGSSGEFSGGFHQNDPPTEHLAEGNHSQGCLNREKVQAITNDRSHDIDLLYALLEDAFRGPRHEIMGRLRVYLPYLRHVRGDAREFAVLDVGCGRGEWLELLRAEGFLARGVDCNRVMVEECQKRGLEVSLGDALEYVQNLPDASVGAVTVFHVVEHLLFQDLIRLLDEITRILQRSGIVIFETPNPNNILVGSRNFYFDPTHRNPIPQETLRFLVKARGLSQIEVMPLNPNPTDCISEGQNKSALVRKFNWYFYGPQDYAIVGRKT